MFNSKIISINTKTILKSLSPGWTVILKFSRGNFLGVSRPQGVICSLRPSNLQTVISSIAFLFVHIYYTSKYRRDGSRKPFFTLTQILSFLLDLIFSHATSTWSSHYQLISQWACKGITHLGFFFSQESGDMPAWTGKTHTTDEAHGPPLPLRRRT